MTKLVQGVENRANYTINPHRIRSKEIGGGGIWTINDYLLQNIAIFEKAR